MRLVRRGRLRDGDRQRRDAGGNPRAVAGQNPFSRLRPSRQFRFCGARSFVGLVRAEKSSRARRTTWWRGTSSAVFRRTSFMSRPAAKCRRRNFAELLADELERREQTEPRGELPAEHAAAIASRRGIYEVRAAHSPETTQHWCSKNSTAWTVVYEADARFQMSCLNRFIYVKAVCGFDGGAARRGRGSRKSFDRRHRRAGRKNGGNGDATGALGRDAGLSARPDAKSAADVAARRPAGAGRFGDVDGFGTIERLDTDCTDVSLN